MKSVEHSHIQLDQFYLYVMCSHGTTACALCMAVLFETRCKLYIRVLSQYTQIQVTSTNGKLQRKDVIKNTDISSNHNYMKSLQRSNYTDYRYNRDITVIMPSTSVICNPFCHF